jgi:DNA-binding winged helix-turn-helix (wHTH) protein
VPKALIEARGEVAGTDALMARVWPDWMVQHLPNAADYTQA